MIFALIAGIAFGSALTIFSLQNATVISVSFLSLHFAAPVAVLLVSAAGIAAVIALLGTLPLVLRAERRVREAQAQKVALEIELAKYRIIFPVAPPSQTMSPISVLARDKMLA